MNQLPVVKVGRVEGGGHQITCSCGEEYFEFTRPLADLTARDHRASHGKDLR